MLKVLDFETFKLVRSLYYDIISDLTKDYEKPIDDFLIGFDKDMYQTVLAYLSSLILHSILNGQPTEEEEKILFDIRHYISKIYEN
jgi:hypothetical protein